MKCDTERTTNSDQCHRCFMDWVHAEDSEEWLKKCHACSIKHLRRNMFEKLDGYYCEDCAGKYERNVLESLHLKGDCYVVENP